MTNYSWNWSVFLQNVPSGDATYIDWIIAGLIGTIVLSITAWILALIMGSIMGTLRTVKNPIISSIASAYIELFRDIPLLVQLFIWFFVIPEFLPQAAKDALFQMPPLYSQFLTAWICLGLFTSARVAEQVRTGIQAVPDGQTAAGLALGFTTLQIYFTVRIPQAIRIIMPALTSEFLNIFKNSSVATTIGFIELSRQAQQLVDYTAQPYEAFIVITALYMLVNIIVMLLMHKLEKKLQIPGYITGDK